jgi:uncharacterized protein
VKVCLDTNVLISAVATRGLAADVLRVVLAEHELLVPDCVLREVERVLTRKLRVPEAAVQGLLQLLQSQTVVPTPPDPLPIEIRDPDDAWVLASAVAAQAAVLVTGDEDLLTLGDQAPLPILSPRGFWEQLRGT